MGIKIKKYTKMGKKPEFSHQIGRDKK